MPKYAVYALYGITPIEMFTCLKAAEKRALELCELNGYMIRYRAAPLVA